MLSVLVCSASEAQGAATQSWTRDVTQEATLLRVFCILTKPAINAKASSLTCLCACLSAHDATTAL